MTTHFAGVAPGDPRLWVLAAGLCELGACIGFTFGMFTRWAAVGTALHILVASVMDGHWLVG